MKHPLTVIVVFLIVTYCNAQQSDLLKLVNPKQTCKLYTTTTIFYSKKDFCSNSIYLNSDSTFLKEQGCEGRSTITLGKWRTVGDSIELKATAVKQLYLICNAELSKQKAINNKVTFIVVDKTGKPIPDFIILPLKKSERYTFTSNAKVVKYSNKKNVELFETNDSGKVVVDCANYDSLEFAKLKMLTGKKHRFSAKNLPDTIKLTLNMNAYGITYPELSYKLLPKPLYFKLAGKKLMRGDMVLQSDVQE